MAKKVINVVSTVILILLVILVAAMFITRIMGNTPSVFGYQVYYVATGSMEPTLNIGDAVLVKKTPAEDIHKGDIITYKGTTGEMYGKTVTHRVVEEPESKNGTYYFQTKGDYEGATLDPVFPYSNVQGKLVTKLPLIGKLYEFFCKPYGLLTFIIIILVLFGYEMISLFVSYKTIDSFGDDYLVFENEGQDKKKAKKSKSEDSEEDIDGADAEEFAEEQAEEEAAQEDTTE